MTDEQLASMAVQVVEWVGREGRKAAKLIQDAAADVDTANFSETAAWFEDIASGAEIG